MVFFKHPYKFIVEIVYFLDNQKNTEVYELYFSYKLTMGHIGYSERTETGINRPNLNATIDLEDFEIYVSTSQNKNIKKI